MKNGDGMNRTRDQHAEVSGERTAIDAGSVDPIERAKHLVKEAVKRLELKTDEVIRPSYIRPEMLMLLAAVDALDAARRQA